MSNSLRDKNPKRFPRRYIHAARRTFGTNRVQVPFRDQTIDFLDWATAYVDQLDPLSAFPCNPDQGPEPADYPRMDHPGIGHSMDCAAQWVYAGANSTYVFRSPWRWPRCVYPIVMRAPTGTDTLLTRQKRSPLPPPIQPQPKRHQRASRQHQYRGIRRELP
jgi:hypothetical protein